MRTAASSLSRERLKAARRDRGSALTELAIVAPIFIYLILWSEFFTDVSIVKLKMVEAARYALWEMTAQRDPAAVATETQYRFRNLISPQDIAQAAPPTRSFPDPINMIVTFQAPGGGPCTFQPRGGLVCGSAPLVGALQPTPYPNPHGFLGLLNSAQDFIDDALQRLLAPGGNEIANMHLSTTGAAQVKVVVQNLPGWTASSNNMFPGGSIGLTDNGYYLGGSNGLDSPGTAQVSTVNFISQSATIMADTWKAWPGPNGSLNNQQDDTVSPLTTYAQNGMNTVEQEVSARLQNIAFNGGANGIVAGIVNLIFGSLGIGGPLSVLPSHSAAGEGPVAMYPGATPRGSQPFYAGVPVQRAGNDTQTTSDTISTPTGIPAGRLASPVAGVDRWRYTMPSKINTVFWSGVGGLGTSPNFGGSSLVGVSPGSTLAVVPTVSTNSAWNGPSYNPYPTMYECRDAYYMGAMTPQSTRWGNAGYYSSSFGSQCAGTSICAGGWCPPGG